MQSLTPDVFISHSTADKVIADTVCEKLEQAGIGCWIAPRNVPAGSNYAAEITRGLRKCRIVVFIFSRKSNESAAVQRELERAFDNRKIIIPFRIEDVPPSDAVDFLIASSQRIEAIPGPKEKHYEELVSAVKGYVETVPDTTAEVRSAPPVEPAPRPARQHRRFPLWIIPALIVLIAGITYGVFSFRPRNPPDAVEIDSPKEGAVLIGDDQNASLLLRYKLPDKLNRKAEIEFSGPDGKIETASTSGNSYLIPSKQGPIRWRIRASWVEKDGTLKNGAWTAWRNVTFDSSRLAKILRTGQCVIGTADLSPDDVMTNYDPATNRPGGYEVELLAKFFESELKARSLPGKVEIDYKPAPEGWGQAFFHMLETDPDVDLLVSGVTPTQAREKEWGVRFSAPSLVFPSALLVRTGEPGLQNAEILPKVIGVADNTTNKDFLVRLFGPQSPRVYVDPGPNSYRSLIARLRSGSIDAFLVDEVYIPTLEKHHPELAGETDVVRLLKEVNPAFEESSAAYVLRPQDGEFLRKLNRFLENSRPVAEELRKKYILSGPK